VIRRPRRPSTHQSRRGPVGDLSDPRGLPARTYEYLSWLAVHNYSPQTIDTREKHLVAFNEWAAEREITRPEQVTLPLLERYQRRLYHHRKKDGQPLSFRHQRSRLSILRGFFKWLVRHRYLVSNPASELELPKLEKRLPKHVLTREEVERVLAEPDLSTPFGLRDRAILETFYSTGIRRMELAGLRLYDVDVERETIVVRQGKGKKDRMIPIGARALAWLETYLGQVRSELVVEPDEGFVFLSQFGEPFRLTALTQLVSAYVRRSGIGKSGACHLFRHTMATLMLEGGADIRYIQQMLGHADLSSTEVYTQVSIRQLKAIHTATHPGAELARRADSTAGAEAEQAGDDVLHREELLASLDAEAAEEDDEQGGDPETSR